jgi:hypothetical protein
MNEKELEQELSQDSSILMKAIGGWQGMIDASLPTAAFLISFTITKELKNSVYVAVGIAAALAGWRVIQRKSLQQITSGLLGLAISAYLATKTGKSENFFVVGILQNTGYFLICLVSILIRKPIVGYIISTLRGQSATAWLRDKDLKATYSAITWLWVLVFGIRVAITAPLYFAGMTTQLGTAKLILGTPLYALAVFISYRVIVTRELGAQKS